MTHEQDAKWSQFDSLVSCKYHVQAKSHFNKPKKKMWMSRIDFSSSVIWILQKTTLTRQANQEKNSLAP